MRLFVFSTFLFFVGGAHGFFDSIEEDNAPSYFINNFYNNEIPDMNSETVSKPRRLVASEGMPKAAEEMMTQFNRNFLNLLTSENQNNWNQLMEMISPNAYIETCMEPAFGLSIDQFHKWMTHLSRLYSKFELTNSVMEDNSITDITTKLIIRTETRENVVGADQWTMSASLDSEKGYFVVNTLKMMNDCKSIPTSPPLEPANPFETFISRLKTKLVSDIFLNGGIRYKSLYESLNTYLDPKSEIQACDVGKLSLNQFVEYWYKRYGKVQTYTNHKFEVVKKGTELWIDFAVTYQGESGTVFQDKMSKHDEAQAKLDLASRRWDQLFHPDISWDTQQAFKELFDQNTFHGYACNACGACKDLGTFQDFGNWLGEQAKFYSNSVPIETRVYAADEKIGFYALNTLTARADNSTSNRRVYFEGFYKDDHWQLNHLGFSCNDK
ncbi:hypothetical protein GCK72_021442 [Caenorhabditis remanei]|uniref:SnoaL-like domain-containing protein n=1 Tax=Caenorhabditis remanei TaxID=31234 RepID=A0A6A5GI58_CAERE|nr:hypothetical protein GCK72_021442 [Caenorhabditis remanei]KAF1754877.1 hypothetical protein GCK72_021442 [Caenorhabditis remanei]